MRKHLAFLLVFLFTGALFAQKTMTPKDLWTVKDVSPIGLSKDGQHFFYEVKTPNLPNNNFDHSYFRMAITGGAPVEVTKEAMERSVYNKNDSPNGKYRLFHKAVHIKDVLGKDVYKDLPKSDVYVINSLDYRHWDHYNDGSYNHVFYKDLATGKTVDIMPKQPYYSPQAPFGGDEDYSWGPNGENIYYIAKKEEGTAYAVSTNTDLYKYNLKTQKTENITADNDGYDTHPVFSKQGALAWLQMDTPGYEADKNDLVVLHHGVKQNLTADWDGTVGSFIWSDDGKTLYFTAPTDGTIQLFEVNYPGKTKIKPTVTQLSTGQFDVTGIIAQTGNNLLVTRTDMNHASEIFSFNLQTKHFQQFTFVNADLYKQFDLPTVKKRYVTTQDGHKMLVWVIYPPHFNKNKKYPTLLYCQGGPQSPLSQFYSRRWNFQLMASMGYIVVAPDRRGMPGFGVKWNEAVSEHWGDGAMQDYLDAIDNLAKESYVDKDRLGAVGASFGGYSIFWLAGHHQGRFKTFIAHDGVFDTRAMYGTTEELWFTNHDLGGPYWKKNDPAIARAYNEYNPVTAVANWDTPILIIQGGKDYRVPIEQGLGAFQAAQLQGIKSKLLYFPDENHWVLKPQNAMVWQRTFFTWLKETL